MIELRREVRIFAEAMERQLRKHDTTRGTTGWKNDTVASLMEHAEEEYGELVWAAAAERPAEEVLAEAADLANMAMMVADVCGGLEETGETAG